MKILLVTEKYNPHVNQRDGGYRLVSTICQVFESVTIMQFDDDYPNKAKNKFERRINNAEYIANKVRLVKDKYTHIFFIHISMQFTLGQISQQVWTFPMFLSTSYRAFGGIIPKAYIDMEKQALSYADYIITPSNMEKQQLIKFGVDTKKIFVVPRGINCKYIKHKIRKVDCKIKLCSVSSIKPQKNILGLLLLYQDLKKYFDLSLKIIGPIQDEEYFELLPKSDVKFVGYVSPEYLCQELDDCHIHISMSKFETFGRSIFETLACGLPNIVCKKGNAAYEFLHDLPYIKFVEDDNIIDIIRKFESNLPILSRMAKEVGYLYDDKDLGRLLAAIIKNKSHITVVDYDGTLFHKGDPVKTYSFMDDFNNHPLKVICSARPIDYLLNQIDKYNLNVDWIIGYSGAVAVDKKGKVIWISELAKSGLKEIEILEHIYFDNKLVQVKALNIPLGYHTEIYEGLIYVSNICKLYAVKRLLKYINWKGKVFTFGDGKYDRKLISHFDGILVENYHERLL